jgi:hypothetical protein
MAFQLCFRYATGKVQVNQEGLKLNGTHQFLVNAFNVNLLDGNINTAKTQKFCLL